LKSGVGVKKLLAAKSAKIKSRQDAVQTTFSVFLDIFYPSNFRCFEGNGLFQQPQVITLTTKLERFVQTYSAERLDQKEEGTACANNPVLKRSPGQEEKPSVFVAQNSDAQPPQTSKGGRTPALLIVPIEPAETALLGCRCSR
jgi:hypothetical protein